jgi:hypothetical protein
MSQITVFWWDKDMARNAAHGLQDTPVVNAAAENLSFHHALPFSRIREIIVPGFAGLINRRAGHGKMILD